MNAICSLCGCCWEASEEEACSPFRQCAACYWHLEPGDQVICVEEQANGCFLRKSVSYTVVGLWKPNGSNLIRVYGSDIWWPLCNFRLVHKIGDTDLKTGM